MADKRNPATARTLTGSAAHEDTVVRSLSKEERARLAMDAWEPSLLRKLLRAEAKLRQRRLR